MHVNVHLLSVFLILSILYVMHNAFNVCDFYCGLYVVSLFYTCCIMCLMYVILTVACMFYVYFTCDAFNVCDFLLLLVCCM